MLTLLVVAPWLGILMVLASPRSRPGLAYASAALAGGVCVGATILLFAGDALPAGLDRPWIEGLGLRLALQVDAFAALHMLVAALLFLGGLLSIWRTAQASSASTTAAARPSRSLAALSLAALGLVLLAFAARDPLLFWVAQEGAAFVLFSALALGGGRERLRTGMSFILHAALGSLPMLVAILDLRMRLGGMDRPLNPDALEALALGPEAQRWGLIAFLLAIATRLGLPPLQGWRRDLGPAPSSLRIYLAAIWISLGSYVALRFVRPLYPEALDAGRGWLVAWGLVAMLLAGSRRLVAREEDQREGATLAFGAGLAWVGIASGEALAMVGGAVLVLANILAVALRNLTRTSPDGDLFFLGPRLVARASLYLCPGLLGFAAWLAILGGVLSLGPAVTLAFAALSLLGIAPQGETRTALGRAELHSRGFDPLGHGLAWIIGLLLLIGGLCPGVLDWLLAASFGGMLR